ncbi:hypothetical protein ACS0TY_034639 [Phlomoides rotata]
MMRRGYESDDSDFGAAVAASAHAIQSLEQQPSFRPPQPPGSTRKASIKDTRSSSSLRPAISFNGEVQIRHKEGSRTLRSSSDSKADVWEKTQIAKIRKRYEKVHSDIQAWENEKKLREKQKLERRKNEEGVRISRNVKHYERKIRRIDNIGLGGRSQVEEKRKDQELIVKEKARKMRLTGKPPLTCFCF